MAKIIFYKIDNTFISKAIGFKTKGKYSHCEILLSDGYMYSSSEFDNGVRKKKHIFNKDKWTYYNINLDEEKVKLFFEKTKNLKYDFIGLLGFFLPFQDRTNKWFCSEWCSNVLKIQGFEFMWELDPAKIHPSKLEEMVYKDVNKF